MRKWNKLLAMALAMVMVFGLTATAFASEGEDGTTPPPITEPAEGEDTPEATEPAEGEDAPEASEPAEGEDAPEASEPAEGDDGDEAGEPADPYADVEDWAKAHVAAIVEKKLMDMGENGFRPEDNMTRVELVVALYRHAESPSVEGKENPFEDISTLNEEQQAAIIWAASEKIVNGAEPTVFNPNGDVERQQIAKILFVYAKAENAEEDELSAFPDKDDVAEYAVDCINWLVAKKIMNGDGDILNPSGTATRAQVATMLDRYITNVLPAAEPAEGDDANEPAEGDDANEPAEGDDANEPAEGDDADKPAEGDDADKPAEGDDADKPAEGDDADKPAEGDKAE